MEPICRKRAAGSRFAAGAGLAFAVVALAGCGGVIKFEDRSAIAISSTAPAAPKAEAEGSRVDLQADRIVIKEKIKFAYNSDEILPESFSLLSEIAAVIKKNPQIKKIEIGGHASTEGDDGKNMQLSKRRADAVREHLVGKGAVTKERLVAKGYGETKPLVKPDATEEQRETNRRVEFLVVEQEPKAGAAAATAKN